VYIWHPKGTVSNPQDGKVYIWHPKGRFRILKTGIRLAGQESTDKLFYMLYTAKLLDEDGLDDAWEDGARSGCEGKLGLNNIQDVEYLIPEAVQMRMSGVEMQRYDISGMGFGRNVLDNEPSILLPPLHRRRGRHGSTQAGLLATCC
jgi:hypothetical protein